MTFLKRLFSNAKAVGTTAATVEAPSAEDNQEHRVPVGFRRYLAKDFQQYFGVSEPAAAQIAADYAEVIAFHETRGFGAELRSNPRNGPEIAKLCAGRYDVPDHVASAVHLFFTFVAIAREHQMKARELKFAKAEWLGSTKTDGASCHAEFESMTFNPQKGMLVEGKFVLPGVSLGCKCTSRPIFEPKL